jgi:hypothetical protein
MISLSQEALQELFPEPFVAAQKQKPRLVVRSGSSWMRIKADKSAPTSFPGISECSA